MQEMAFVNLRLSLKNHLKNEICIPLEMIKLPPALRFRNGKSWNIIFSLKLF